MILYCFLDRTQYVTIWKSPFYIHVLYIHCEQVFPLLFFLNQVIAYLILLLPVKELR